MAELDPFGAPAGTPGGPALGNGVAGEEDPAAAFLAQQESEIAGIENDEAFAILDGGAPGPQPHGEPPGSPGESAARLGAGGLVWKLGPKWLGELRVTCSLLNREVECREETRPRPSHARNLGLRRLLRSVGVFERSWARAGKKAKQSK